MMRFEISQYILVKHLPEYETFGNSIGQGSGFKSLKGLKFEISASSAPLANSAIMSTLTEHCQWEDETVKERTGHPPSYAEAKKMKPLTLQAQGCLRASSRDSNLKFIAMNELEFIYYSISKL